MKKIIFTLLLTTVLLSANAQVYYGTGAKTQPEVLKSARLSQTPTFTIDWQKADFSGLSMPSVFNEFTLQNGTLHPQMNVTTGLAKVWGAADMKVTITQGTDTTIELKSVMYYGIATSFGLANIFNGGETSPMLVVGGIVGIDEYATIIGVDFLAKNPLTGKTSPALMIGFTLNIRDLPFLRNSTTITAKGF